MTTEVSFSKRYTERIVKIKSNLRAQPPRNRGLEDLQKPKGLMRVNLN
jgi:hypothetical protein